MKIGFFGTGIMGSRMAANLCKHGNNVIVYNRTLEKAEPLASKGAVIAKSPQELVSEVDFLFTMLSTPEVVEQVSIGEDGFVNHMKNQSIWVDCSTVNPSFTRRIAKESEQRNVRFVDAPAAGTKGPAQTGDLVFLVGGKDKDVKACVPYLEMMGRKVIHVGATGMGTSLKMVFNLLLGETMAAFSEALVLGESLGISREILLDSLIGSPVVAPFLEGKKNKISEGNYDTEFPLKWMQKDLQLASQCAYETNTSLPAVNVIKELFALAKQNGLAEKDFSALHLYLKNRVE